MSFGRVSRQVFLPIGTMQNSRFMGSRGPNTSRLKQNAAEEAFKVGPDSFQDLRSAVLPRHY